MFGAAFAGRHTADDLRAIFFRLFGVKGPLAAGDALADNFGFLVDKNGHVRSVVPLQRAGPRAFLCC